MPNKPVNHIVIAGGGTAGWMTAAYLARWLEPTNIQVTLVESELIGTVGVGEATIPPFLDFNKLLEIDERELLAEVQGSSTLYNNWAYQPFTDESRRFIRGSGAAGPTSVKARARFPYVEPVKPDR